MSKKKKHTKEAGVENVDKALSNAEHFIEENQKPITTAVAIILAALALFMGVKKLYIIPTEEEAQSLMFNAEKYFEADSFRLALYGDGNNYGFEDIIDNYKITKSANLAKYYAGICNLKMGEFDLAIDYLESYKIKEKMLASVVYGAIGDAYSEMDDLDAALKYYIKATDVKNNEFTTPIYLMKAAIVNEALGDYESALKNYQLIKEEFKDTEQGDQIDKFITRAEAMLAKQ